VLKSTGIFFYRKEKMRFIPESVTNSDSRASDAKDPFMNRAMKMTILITAAVVKLVGSHHYEIRIRVKEAPGKENKGVGRYNLSLVQKREQAQISLPRNSEADISAF
jgi:hypothetical protein